VNIPTISELEWHPFTISSLPTDDTITNHIKVMGKNEWTEKLNLLGKKNEYNNGQNNLAVNIDGPYGVVLPYEKYNHILFIAGGIGITPLQAQFRFICENYLNDRFNGKSLEKVTLLWSTKTSAEANVFLGKVWYIYIYY
jgi:predicted ferric reductase